MGDLEVNAEALRSSASLLRSGADGIPLSAAGVDAGNCGSPIVVGAADEFSLWAALTAQGVVAKLRSAAEVADLAAAAYSEADLALAEGS
jgi:hypothetical protein